jgi:hypothetical protein
LDILIDVKISHLEKSFVFILLTVSIKCSFKHGELYVKVLRGHTSMQDPFSSKGRAPAGVVMWSPDVTDMAMIVGAVDVFMPLFLTDTTNEVVERNGFCKCNFMRVL